jgi:hypothetical protein
MRRREHVATRLQLCVLFIMPLQFAAFIAAVWTAAVWIFAVWIAAFVYGAAATAYVQRLSPLSSLLRVAWTCFPEASMV